LSRLQLGSKKKVDGYSELVAIFPINPFQASPSAYLHFA
jgi:hypothetical protein